MDSDLSLVPVDPPEAPDQSDTETSSRRQCSKIAKLPDAVREQLNLMLADGLGYEEVIERLGDAGSHLTKMDVSRWMHSGHQFWLKQAAWLDRVQVTFTAAKGMVDEGKAFSIHEANLHLAATAMNEAIVGFDWSPVAVQRGTPSAVHCTAPPAEMRWA